MSNLFKQYGAHLVGYVVAGAGVISGLAPGVIPPKYSFLTAVAGLIAIAAHHGFTAGNANAAITAAANAAAAAANKPAA